MLALALAWLLAALLGPARAAPRGFDHAGHAAQVGLAAPVACGACHGASGLARPGHAACFGACHGGSPALVVGDRGVVCAACHADAAAPHPAAPFPIGRDLAASLGHARHAAIACAQCHAAPLGAPVRPHARCAGCHDGAPGRGPAMAACATCHVAGRAPARLDPDALPLAFSHPRHAARGEAGRACASCHADVARAAAGDPVPAAPLATCTGCHDGRAAFAVTAACTRCHDAAPTRAWTAPAPGARFSHAAHGAAATACATCHALTAAGEPEVAGHAACAGCHRLHPDAAARSPREAAEAPICGACHDGTEPWRHLVADRAPPDATELGASLDHGAHPAACTGCHTRRTPTSQLRMPHGHVACSGAACHARTGGPAPTLATCAGCHRLGLAADRLAARIAAPWSVRAAFDHARHDARAEVPCASCHAGLAGAPLLALPTPAKATCAPCHDGRAAFKLTGTTCRKCHL